MATSAYISFTADISENNRGVEIKSSGLDLWQLCFKRLNRSIPFTDTRTAHKWIFAPPVDFLENIFRVYFALHIGISSKSRIPNVMINIAPIEYSLYLLVIIPAILTNLDHCGAINIL